MSDFWTIQALKEHVDQRFDDMQDAVRVALEAQKEQTTFQFRVVSIGLGLLSLLIAVAAIGISGGVPH